MDLILQQLDILGTPAVTKFGKKRERKQVTLDFKIHLLELTCYYRKGDKEILDTSSKYFSQKFQEIKEISEDLNRNFHSECLRHQGNTIRSCHQPFI